MSLFRATDSQGCERVFAIGSDPQRAKQIEQYKGLKCCVCGKWGANARFGEPITALKVYAASCSITLRAPCEGGTHDKCLTKLKALLAQKSKEKENV